MIGTDITKVRATGEVCFGDGKTEVERNESDHGCGLEGGTSVFSQRINVEIAIKGRMATIIAGNGVHPENVGLILVGRAVSMVRSKNAFHAQLQ